MTEIKLFYDPHGHERRPENEGLYDTEPDRLLSRVKEAGLSYDVIDVSAMPRGEIEDAYSRLAVTPSVRKRYRVKRIFGTNKYPGCRFGKGVPALIVLEDGRAQDVYPHEEEGGKIVTIKDYVDGLERARRNTELVKRMDALRARIGKVGVSVRALVHEGRRR